MAEFNKYAPAFIPSVPHVARAAPAAKLNLVTAKKEDKKEEKKVGITIDDVSKHRYTLCKKLSHKLMYTLHIIMT
jgi:hypothetical protein